MASIEPARERAPNSSRISSAVSRREMRFLTARVATAACRRGPKAPGGTSAGSSARVSAPQSGQRRRWRRCSVRRIAIDGSSATWWRAGLPTGQRSASLNRWPQAQRSGQCSMSSSTASIGASRRPRPGWPGWAPGRAPRTPLAAAPARRADPGWAASRSCGSCGSGAARARRCARPAWRPLAQLGDLTPERRSAPTAPRARRRRLRAPAHRSPPPRRVPCPRGSRCTSEGLPISPRLSLSAPQVDQLNAYQFLREHYLPSLETQLRHRQAEGHDQGGARALLSSATSSRGSEASTCTSSPRCASRPSTATCSQTAACAEKGRPAPEHRPAHSHGAPQGAGHGGRGRPALPQRRRRRVPRSGRRPAGRGRQQGAQGLDARGALGLPGRAARRSPSSAVAS